MLCSAKLCWLNIKRENIFQDYPHQTSGVGVNHSFVQIFRPVSCGKFENVDVCTFILFRLKGVSNLQYPKSQTLCNLGIPSDMVGTRLSGSYYLSLPCLLKYILNNNLIFFCISISLSCTISCSSIIMSLYKNTYKNKLCTPGVVFTHAYFQKIAQISRLCDFHYISEGIPSLICFWLLMT